MLKGFVTQQRKTSEGLPWKFQYGLNPITRSGAVLPPLNDETQVTTSFRTGPGYVYNTPKTKTEFFRSFVEEASFDTGHDFNTIKREARYSHENHTLDSGTGVIYRGPLRINQDSLPSADRWKPWSTFDTFDPTYWGTRAINVTRPTQPVASLSQALTEIYREGLPSLLGAAVLKGRVKAARDAGSEYLNIQFGWLPLISDIVSMLHAVVDAEKHIKQYKRDSGRQVRRNYTFPLQAPETSYSMGTKYLQNVPNSSRWGQLFPGGAEGPHPSSIETFKQTVYRFSGAYTYYLPSGDNFGDKMSEYAAQAQHLLGIRLTPDVLWNLAPWTWLADWFFNVGDNLEVATSFSHDGLLLKYGYIMRETTAQKTYTTWDVRDRRLFDAGVIREVYTTKEKLRIRADPYGFAVKPDQFTDRQWAILAALGMSRGQGNLARFGE